MCGLAGLLGPGSFDSGLVGAMGLSLAHRGPDGQGEWRDPAAGIALVHRRLSILDLSPAGAQPMVSADGRWVLAFNGEIYDHADLRAALEADSPIFWRGHSDTEVLLEAIASWGVESALSRCNGMFAFAAWDRRERSLVLARDRTGEKPLYVGAVGHDLVFASELKAFRRHPAWRHAVDPDALAWLFEVGYVPAPWSIHPGVFKLPAGSLLKLSAEDANWRPCVSEFSRRADRWWKLEDVVARAKASPWTEGKEAALAAVRETIDDAVRLRMLADVPVGALLSGGVDSTLVVASMARQSSRPVRTFTVGFDVPAIDEADHALATARHFGTQHTEVNLPAGAALSLVGRLPEVYDEPFADAAQLPAMLVAEAARRQVVVALTGDGGDEVFHGYQRYLDAERIWAGVGKLSYSVRRAMASVCKITGRACPAGETRSRMLRQAGRIGARDIEDYGAALMRFPGARAVVRAADPAWPGVPAPLAGAGVGERLRFLDQAFSLPEGIHAKLDRASMSVGLELRVPLLDPRLLELAWRMPAHWHARGGVGKRLLRQLAREAAPSATALRRKQGFDVPVSAWLRGPLRDWAESLLSPSALAREPLLDPLHVRALWEDHLARRADHGYALWALLMFRSWSEHHA